jgi:hypothetical protein
MVNYLSEIPPPDFFNAKGKKAVVLEDIDFLSMSKLQRGNLDRLLGYVSSHKQTSIFITCQNFHNIPASVRRMCNFFVLYKTNDLTDYNNIAKKVGISIDTFHKTFHNMKNKRDSLWIDLTENTPYPLRLNGCTLLDPTTCTEIDRESVTSAEVE